MLRLENFGPIFRGALNTYWLIDPNTTRIDCFTRTEGDDWLLHSYTHAEEVVAIKALSMQFTLKELYEDILMIADPLPS
jgi:Uma2 family endonuclease